MFGILVGTWFLLLKNIGSSCYGHPSDYSYFNGKIEKRSIECICCFVYIVIFSISSLEISIYDVIFCILGSLTAYPYYYLVIKLYHTHNRYIILGTEIFEYIAFDGYLIYKILIA